MDDGSPARGAGADPHAGLSAHLRRHPRAGHRRRRRHVARFGPPNSDLPERFDLGADFYRHCKHCKENAKLVDGDDVVVICDRLWGTGFGRDPAVIGTTYFVSDSIKQVVGLMPPDFQLASDETMRWVATPVLPEQLRPGQCGVPVIARIKPGVSHAQLAAEPVAGTIVTHHGGDDRCQAGREMIPHHKSHAGSRRYPPPLELSPVEQHLRRTGGTG